MDPKPVSAPLVLDGKPTRIERAELCISVMSGGGLLSKDGNPDRAELNFGLYVVVDEHSGEDGEPAPSINSIPISRRNGRYPLPQELSGIVVDVANDDAWEASYGNDAPNLRNNWLQFGEWQDGVLQLHWRAEWSWDETDGPHTVEFHGPVRFDGIHALVADEAHLIPFVDALWGKGAIEKFEVARHPWKKNRPDDPGFGPVTLWPRALSRGGRPLEDWIANNWSPI